MRTLVQHRKVRLETLRDVIRVEDRDSGRVFQSVSAHQLDVGVRNRKNAGASPRGRRYCPDFVPAIQSDHWMPRQKRNKVLRHTDWTHARAAAPVRNAERLVEIQMADIGANFLGAAQ